MLPSIQTPGKRDQVHTPRNSSTQSPERKVHLSKTRQVYLYPKTPNSYLGSEPYSRSPDKQKLEKKAESRIPIQGAVGTSARQSPASGAKA